MANITQYDNPLLNSAIQKSWKRLVPLMFIMYFVAFIDRVNVGFAKDAMKLDIGLSESAFALGAGIFFAAYALFGIPANLILNKIGAQKWLSITTAIWGLLSAMTGFVTSETQFIILRFLLGLGEAGFYPGILLLASIYFPNKVRGSVVGIFVLGVPLALTLGSPISGALLELHGWMGRPGWFWMFVIEGLPALVLGIFAWFYLDDNPTKARFLTQEEKDALNKQLAAAVGLALSAFAGPVVAIGALCLSAVGFLSVQPIFWTFPPQLLTGPALAAGIGFCTTMGAFCSFLAPLIRVEVDRAMDSSIAGLMALSVITIGCALLIGLLQKSQQAAKAYS